MNPSKPMAIDRQSPRKVADRILSIRVEPNNDAVVLDFSDEGMGFRALYPVTRLGPICFSFLENGQRVVASGEVIWTDATKKTGGLSFASLPRANCARIRNWLDRAGPPKMTPGSSEPAAAAAKESPISGARPERANAGAVPFTPAPGMSQAQSELPGFALFEDNAQRARDTWYPAMPYPNSGTKFFSGFFAGAIFSGIIIVILLFVFGDQASVLLAEWKARTGATPREQSTTAAQPPLVVPPPLAPSGIPPSSGPEAPPLSESISPHSEDSKATEPASKHPVETPSANDQPSPATGDSQHKSANHGEEDLALAATLSQKQVRTRRQRTRLPCACYGPPLKKEMCRQKSHLQTFTPAGMASGKAAIKPGSCFELPPKRRAAAKRPPATGSNDSEEVADNDPLPVARFRQQSTECKSIRNRLKSCDPALFLVNVRSFE